MLEDESTEDDVVCELEERLLDEELDKDEIWLVELVVVITGVVVVL